MSFRVFMENCNYIPSNFTCISEFKVDVRPLMRQVGYNKTGTSDHGEHLLGDPIVTDNILYSLRSKVNRGGGGRNCLEGRLRVWKKRAYDKH